MNERGPKVAVLKWSGINCEGETDYAFTQAGARSEIVLVNDLKSGRRDLSEFQIAAFPGGFSAGDHLGSGTVAAIDLNSSLGNQYSRFIERGIAIGICNGFQILTRSGILPNGELGKREATLDKNDSGHFENRRVNLSVGGNCVFLKELEDFGPVEFQVAHGEGKFVASQEVLYKLEANNQVAFRYVDGNGNPTQEYPLNPNGSPNAIAGITDPTGRVLGLMPHPERSTESHHYPNIRRYGPDFQPEGRVIFQRMVDYAKAGI